MLNIDFGLQAIDPSLSEFVDSRTLLADVTKYEGAVGFSRGAFFIQTNCHTVFRDEYDESGLGVIVSGLLQAVPIILTRNPARVRLWDGPTEFELNPVEPGLEFSMRKSTDGRYIFRPHPFPLVE